MKMTESSSQSKDNKVVRGYLEIDDKKYEVYDGVNPIGRNLGAVIKILSMEISTSHAVIVILNENSQYLSDLNSCSGTFLDDVKLNPFQLYDLKNNHTIRFGNIIAAYSTINDNNDLNVNQQQQIIPDDEEGFFKATTEKLKSPTSHNFHELPTQIFDSVFQQPATPSSSKQLTINEMPTLLLDDSSKTQASKQLTINEMTTQLLDNSSKTQDAVDIHDLPTQIFETSSEKPNLPEINEENSNDSIDFLVLEKDSQHQQVESNSEAIVGVKLNKRDIFASSNSQEVEKTNNMDDYEAASQIHGVRLSKKNILLESDDSSDTKSSAPEVDQNLTNSDTRKIKRKSIYEIVSDDDITDIEDETLNESDCIPPTQQPEPVPRIITSQVVQDSFPDSFHLRLTEEENSVEHLEEIVEVSKEEMLKDSRVISKVIDATADVICVDEPNVKICDNIIILDDDSNSQPLQSVNETEKSNPANDEVNNEKRNNVDYEPTQPAVIEDKIVEEETETMNEELTPIDSVNPAEILPAIPTEETGNKSEHDAFNQPTQTLDEDDYFITSTNNIGESELLSPPTSENTVSSTPKRKEDDKILSTQEQIFGEEKNTKKLDDSLLEHLFCVPSTSTKFASPKTPKRNRDELEERMMVIFESQRDDINCTQQLVTILEDSSKENSQGSAKSNKIDTNINSLIDKSEKEADQFLDTVEMWASKHSDSSKSVQGDDSAGKKSEEENKPKLQISKTTNENNMKTIETDASKLENVSKNKNTGDQDRDRSKNAAKNKITIDKEVTIKADEKQTGRSKRVVKNKSTPNKETDQKEISRKTTVEEVTTKIIEKRAARPKSVAKNENTTIGENSTKTNLKEESKSKNVGQNATVAEKRVSRSKGNAQNKSKTNENNFTKVDEKRESRSKSVINNESTTVEENTIKIDETRESRSKSVANNKNTTNAEGAVKTNEKEENNVGQNQSTTIVEKRVGRFKGTFHNKANDTTKTDQKRESRSKNGANNKSTTIEENIKKTDETQKTTSKSVAKNQSTTDEASVAKLGTRRGNRFRNDKNKNQTDKESVDERTKNTNKNTVEQDQGKNDGKTDSEIGSINDKSKDDQKQDCRSKSGVNNKSTIVKENITKTDEAQETRSKSVANNESTTDEVSVAKLGTRLVNTSRKVKNKNQTDEQCDSERTKNTNKDTVEHDEGKSDEKTDSEIDSINNKSKDEEIGETRRGRTRNINKNNNKSGNGAKIEPINESSRKSSTRIKKPTEKIVAQKELKSEKNKATVSVVELLEDPRKEETSSSEGIQDELPCDIKSKNLRNMRKRTSCIENETIETKVKKITLETISESKEIIEDNKMNNSENKTESLENTTNKTRNRRTRNKEISIQSESERESSSNTRKSLKRTGSVIDLAPIEDTISISSSSEIKSSSIKSRRLSANSKSRQSSVISLPSKTKSQKCLSPARSEDEFENRTLNSSCFGSPERSRRKLKPKVVFTMMDSPELESVIRQLGGMVVDTVDACTVLVTQNVKRSCKLLTAVGQGKPICSSQWLLESKKSWKFLDPWDYILIDKEAEKKWEFSLKESLERSTKQKLFENYTFHVIVSTAADVLKGAIESCGGKCVARVTNKNIPNNLIIVASADQKPKYSKIIKQNPNVIAVEPEAIFDGTLRQEKRFERHILK